VNRRERSAGFGLHKEIPDVKRTVSYVDVRRIDAALKRVIDEHNRQVEEIFLRKEDNEGE